MMREERIGGQRLILGDSRSVLPDLGRFDVVLTDPVWPNCPPESVAGWDRPYELWAEICAAIQSPLRIVVVMRCDSDPRFLSAIPAAYPFFRSIQLPYVIPGYIGRVLGGDETAYWFGPAIAVAPGRRLVPGRGPSVQPGGRKANGHPMARAQAHFDWLAAWCADAGETIVDPYMGSGTTLVACQRLGIRGTGIEIDPLHFDNACRRVDEAARQPDLLVEPPPRFVQIGADL
jgi:site-specific DNA-methyltransferase (adenine-specific)